MLLLNHSKDTEIKNLYESEISYRYQHKDKDVGPVRRGEVGSGEVRSGMVRLLSCM
jgi:hypothetical protein